VEGENGSVVETTPLRSSGVSGQSGGMYLKRNRRGGYEYWTLVQSERTARGPRQRVVAHLGKGPGLDEAERRDMS